MTHPTTWLVILVAVLLMTVTATYDYVSLVHERERGFARVGEDARVFAETLALAIRRNVRRSGTTAELQELLDGILARPGLELVAIFDPDGRAVVTTAVPDIPPPAADAAIDGAIHRREARSSVAIGDSPGVRIIRPFRWLDERTGAVEVRQSLASVQEDFAQSLRSSLLSRLVALLLFVVAIVGVTRWSIARPVRALVKGARAIAEGDLGQRIDVSRSGEIGELAREFDRMAVSLQAANQALLAESEARLALEREVHQAQRL